jgi:hypothetical protein
VHGGQPGGKRAVHLLGKREVGVAGPQTGFDMMTACGACAT